MQAKGIDLPDWAEPLFRPKPYKVLRGGRGCLAKGEKVIMADGSLRAIEDVRVGDRMMGPDSKPRTVIDLHRGTEMMYRVKQTSANDYVVNGAHVLVLRKSRSCALDQGPLMPSGNRKSPRGRYPDDPDEVEITVEDWLKKSARWRDSFRGFRAGVINFERRSVAVDPYLLGLWLGDGLHRELMITSADEEIVEWLRGYADRAGVGFSVSAKYGSSNRAVDVRLPKIAGVHGRHNPVWDGFKEYDLPGNKHIPEAYFVNDEETRLTLLAGLIDSDGHYARGGYVISLANERLAKDVKRLADGLGFRTSIARKKTTCQTGAVGAAWSVSINGGTQRVPCLLPRKRATTSPNKDKMLSMLTIEPVGVDDYYGVELDGDRRFLLEDGTVTHNSGKSWTVARVLLLLGTMTRHRVVCGREYQASIRQSVHRLLSDQIHELGLSNFYRVLDTEIRGANGTLFLFTGLAQHTVDSVKSLEGATITWIEEGQSVSKKSLDVLTPTVMRTPGAELWVTFNPDLDTDEVYVRYVEHYDPQTMFSIKVNHTENPWFPPGLEIERQATKLRAPEDYDNVWGGECRQAVQGAIYAKEIGKAVEDGRVGLLPYDPRMKVHVVFDLGWNDSMVIAFVQRHLSSVRIIDAIKDSHRTVDSYMQDVKAKPYNWGKVWLPHDGFTKDLKTGRSVAEIIRRHNFRVERVPSVSVESGIKVAREVLGQTAFDKKKANDIVESLRRYKRAINSTTNEPGAPVHDDASHGADCFRYVALCADKMTNEDEVEPIDAVPFDPFDREMGY